MDPSEKNKIIHEKIMGLCWHELSHGDADYNSYCKHCSIKTLADFKDLNSDYYHNIADAFKLVEKMRDDGFELSLKSRVNKEGYKYVACFERLIPWELFDWFKGTTPSAAITDACLKAIGEEI